jgi:predicted XRE-type DNA-binding protein
MRRKIELTKSSGNVFKDAGYSDEEAKNLQFRSYLMIALRKYILDKGWSQKEAAKKLEVTQPRISNLMHGKIYLFSLGVLIEMLEKAGFKIYEKIEKNIDKEFKTHHWACSVAEDKSQ